MAWVERDAAVFAQLFDALAAVEAGDFVGGRDDGAIRLDEVGRPCEQDAGRGVVEEFLGDLAKILRVVAKRLRLLRRTDRHRPIVRTRDWAGNEQQGDDRETARHERSLT